MANRYEDKTQRLVSHNWSEEYKENHERIFGKKETWLERREREAKEKKCKNEECFCTGECKITEECINNPENCLQYDNCID